VASSWFFLSTLYFGSFRLHYRPSDPVITPGNFFVDYLGVQKLITPNELKTDIDDAVQISSDTTRNTLQGCFSSIY
jgi:hypothetical protein